MELSETQPAGARPWSLLTLAGCVLVLLLGAGYFQRHLRPYSQLQSAQIAGLSERREALVACLENPERREEIAAGFRELSALAERRALSLMAYALIDKAAALALEDDELSERELAELARLVDLVLERGGELSLTEPESRELLRAAEKAMREDG